MKNLRKLGRAFAFSMLMGAGIVTFSPTLHAADGGQSVAVRCGLLLRAIDSASAVFGADSELVKYLWEQYGTYCAG